jgi:hypothetical protein
VPTVATVESPPESPRVRRCGGSKFGGSCFLESRSDDRVNFLASIKPGH